jgi:hypothetical protein
MKSNRGKPKPNPPAPAAKQPPRTLPGLPGSSNSEDRLCWRFTHADKDGPWGFGHLESDAICELLAQLVKFESMTVNEAFHAGDYPGKCYDLDALPNQLARERLDVLNLADQTKIWRLRISGTGRLYGFLTGNVFHVVFWDPDHEIWPSQLRNT